MQGGGRPAGRGGQGGQQGGQQSGQQGVVMKLYEEGEGPEVCKLQENSTRSRNIDLQFVEKVLGQPQFSSVLEGRVTQQKESSICLKGYLTILIIMA